MASGNSLRSASSSSSGPVLERSDEMAPGNSCDPSKTQNPKKRGMAVEFRMTVSEIFLTGWRSSQIIWRTQKCLHPHRFLRTQVQNVLRKWHLNQGNTVFILTSQKTDTAKSACEPKMTGGPCRRRTGEAVRRADMFW